MKAPNLPKIYMLVALRFAESRRGVGFERKIESPDLAVARALERDRMLTLRHAPAPIGGTVAKLTDKGRKAVDDIVASVGSES